MLNNSSQLNIFNANTWHAYKGNLNRTTLNMQLVGGVRIPPAVSCLFLL